jgi:hypothetical protein
MSSTNLDLLFDSLLLRVLLYEEESLTCLLALSFTALEDNGVSLLFFSSGSLFLSGVGWASSTGSFYVGRF